MYTTTNLIVLVVNSLLVYYSKSIYKYINFLHALLFLEGKYSSCYHIDPIRIQYIIIAKGVKIKH
jgi:hypothetical protein